jgi:hypothetical protein
MTDHKPPYMSAADVRRAFLEFFRDRGHAIVASASLVPGNDPTLLFTNAGMVQFKDVFLGKEERDYRRATTAQRCVRAGGKHNDLENVGYTARHHTFFEMLGNFSFGDYFKKDAIRFAWDFVTGTLKLDPQRLWVTVYREDDEAADIWLKDIGIPAGRFARLGEKSNFWSMGDTGPCGPCTEIFYDHGPGIAGGPPGSPDEDGDRYVEIWNLVFMQYDRGADGKMTPLPKPSVDTGMGLERIAAVLQGVHSNYDIDLFQGLIAAAAEATHQKKKTSPSLRVIADHIRACSFLIVDGVIPGNDGRGYVLRRIIRRAIRHGYKLGQEKPFFYQLVPALAAEMGEAFPELPKSAAHVAKVLRQEEERFAETLENGMELLETVMKKLKGKTIPGDTVFKLYDTYGFPWTHCRHARERGLGIDQVASRRRWRPARARPRREPLRRGPARHRHSTPRASSAVTTACRRGTITAILRRAPRSRCAAREEVRSPTTRLLCRVRRPGRRRRRTTNGAARLRDRHPEAGRRAPARRQGRVRQLQQGRYRHGQRRRRYPPGDSAEPQRDALCTRRCARCSARTSCRRARWWRPIACASISRTPSRCRNANSKRSSGSSTPRSAPTGPRKYGTCLTTPRSSRARWRCSAKSTATRCACCASGTFRPSSAAARTWRAPATSACSASPTRVASPPASAASKL